MGVFKNNSFFLGGGCRKFFENGVKALSKMVEKTDFLSKGSFFSLQLVPCNFVEISPKFCKNVSSNVLRDFRLPISAFATVAH